MLYLDTSALVKVYVEEDGSSIVRGAVDRADVVVTSALAYVEARAALVRRRHEGAFSLDAFRRVVSDLDADWEHYLVVEVSAALIRDSARLAEAHRLRAYDAVHLASAAVVDGGRREPVVFACWDADLDRAARREGLSSLRGAR